MKKSSYVYIISNKKNSVLYTGVTQNLLRRIAEHKAKVINGFAKKYGVDKLVYYEMYPTILEGVSREKQIKNWKRSWKEDLINEFNPSWEDLSADVGVDDEWIREVKKYHDNLNKMRENDS